jgi:hypothetical protein
MRTLVGVLTLTWLASAPATVARCADVSPDGALIAVGWPAAVTGTSCVALVERESGSLRIVGSSSPQPGVRWAPDGSAFAFQGADGRDAATRLYDVKGGSARTLTRAFGPPYAWREDGKRIAGVSRQDDGSLDVAFYSVTERGETFRVAAGVDEVLAIYWLPNTDDVALLGRVGSKADVYLIESGQASKISTSGDVLALQLDVRRHELVWARSSRNARYILLTLYAFSLSTRSVRRLPLPPQVAAINPTPLGPNAVDWVVIAPSCDRLAVLATYGQKADARSAPQAAVRRLYSLPMSGVGARLVRTMPASVGPASVSAFWSLKGDALGVRVVQADRTTLALYGGDGGSGRILAQTTAAAP